MNAYDHAQLALIQQGDGQAMAEIYDRYSGIVYSVALRVLRSPACAEDVLQEVFLLIWRSPGRFIDAQGDLRSWLARAARNRSIDVIRKRRPTESIEDAVVVSPRSVATDAEHALMCEKARRLILSLPPPQQQVLNLAYFSGMTHAEIAEVTGCRLGTVKTRIRSGLLSLRKGMSETGTATLRSSCQTL